MSNETKQDFFKVSFSSLETYKTCPRKYYYSYVLKLPKIERSWFIFGNFNHLILEKLFKYIIYFKKRNVSYDKKDLMYRAFQSSVRKYTRLADRGIGLRVTPAQIIETKKILKKFYEKIQFDEPNVYCVEKEFFIDLGDGIRLVGYIDRVDQIGEDTFAIVDYKTSKQAYDIDKNIQLDLYAIGFKTTMDRPVKVYKQLDFIKIGKMAPKVPEKHDDAKDGEILQDIRDLSNKIRTKKELHSQATDEWEPIDNKFCWSCDFKDRCFKDRGIKEELFGD